MQEIWSQNYDPAGNVWVSALVALIPILFFFLALTKLRLKGYVAGTITVVHRRGLHRHPLVQPRRRHPALRVLSLDCAGLPDGSVCHIAGLCLALPSDGQLTAH